MTQSAASSSSSSYEGDRAGSETSSRPKIKLQAAGLYTEAPVVGYMQHWQQQGWESDPNRQPGRESVEVSSQYKKPPTISDDLVIDEAAVYRGTCTFYSKWKGFGFIDVAEEFHGVIPGNCVWVHWKNIHTQDRHPFLLKGMEVEFGVMKWMDSNAGGLTLRAKNVSVPGGEYICVQDEIDSCRKEFLGGAQDLRYSGILKFFSPKSGFGYIEIDQGYDFDESVPRDLRVERSEVNCGGEQPGQMSGIAVEFGIWRSLKGMFKAYNMTLPAGIPMTQANLENRMAVESNPYTGTIEIYCIKHCYGFIKLTDGLELPPHIEATLVAQTRASREKALSRGRDHATEALIYFRQADVRVHANIMKGKTVSFHVYMDDKGVGANLISILD